MKASRDIIVHNSGIANHLYIAKSGKKARARLGDRLQINRAYFEGARHTMKRLIHSVYAKSLDQFGDHRPGTKRNRSLPTGEGAVGVGQAFWIACGPTVLLSLFSMQDFHLIPFYLQRRNYESAVPRLATDTAFLCVTTPEHRPAIAETLARPVRHLRILQQSLRD
jgi:hypothetical protein